jgi:hypothetical protein
MVNGINMSIVDFLLNVVVYLETKEWSDRRKKGLLI